MVFAFHLCCIILTGASMKTLRGSDVISSQRCYILLKNSAGHIGDCLISLHTETGAKGISPR